MLCVKPIHTRILPAGSQRSPLVRRRDEGKKQRTEEQREYEIKTDVKIRLPPARSHSPTSSLQAPRERGAGDDGMTNGIWHAMHTADKGEGNRATVCPSSIWGTFQEQDVHRVEIFREHRGDSASLGFSANNMQLKYSSSTVWKCVGERDGMG